MSQINSGSSSGETGTGILTINDISADTDNNFTLSSLNGITLTGVSNGIDIKNVQGVSKYTVDSQGNAAYTTIQAAVTAALSVATSTTPQTVWIWPGTYAESGTLTLHPFVNLAAAANGVKITAACSLTTTGVADSFYASQISFEASPGSAFTINQTSGSGYINLYFDSCNFAPTNGNCITATSTNSGNSEVYLTTSTLQAGSSGRVFVFNGFYLSAYSCQMFASSAISSFTGTNNCETLLIGCNLEDSFTCTSNMFNLAFDCTFSPPSINGAYNLDSTCTLFISDCTMISISGGYWVLGEGTITYSGISIINSTLPVVAQGTTLDAGTLQTGSISFDGGTTTFDPVTQAVDNAVLLGTGTSALSSLTSVDNAVLITSISGVPEWLANSSTEGYVLTSNSGAPPTWQSVSESGALTEISTNSGNATPSSGVITLSGGSTGLTTVGSSSTVSLQGTLGVGYGGTGSADLTGVLLGNGSSAVTGITTTDNGVLVTSNAGVPSWLSNGTAGQILTANLGAPPSWQSSTAFTSINVQTFTTSGVYTPSSGMVYVMVQLMGGGGGGAGCNTTTSPSVSAGAGGGAGGYAMYVYSASQISPYAIYSIGTGGSGGAAGANAGSAGGTSSFFGGVIMACTGGSGGSASLTSAIITVSTGGLGGTGTNGSINVQGSPGLNGTGTVGRNATTSAVSAGSGGSSYFGAGGQGATLISTSTASQAAGSAGTGYGSGGSGACMINGGTSQAGGAGANGYLVITEFIA